MEETNEIRFMQEYRENVITKIDELQNKLNLVINEFLLNFILPYLLFGITPLIVNKDFFFL